MLKILILSIYYLIYLTMEAWMTSLFVIAMLSAGVIGFFQKRGISCNVWKKILFIMTVLLYVGIVFWTYTGNISEVGVLGNVLRILFYAGTLVVVMGVGNEIKVRLQEGTALNSLEIKNWKPMRWMCSGLYLGSLIPLALIAPYVYPKADDFSFGYHAHRAWEATGSLVEVFKAAIVMIEEAYFDWQGTYTSVFLMSIQPAVFDERLYRIVPFLFVGMITVASYFFWRTVLIEWLHADKVLSQVAIGVYIIFVIQRMPDSQSAFIWYNGAVHYITSHCMVLCMMAFMLKIYLGKWNWYIWLGAALSAFYVGGGNYVTAIGTLLICLTVFFIVLLTKTWKKYKDILAICLVYFLALSLNILAPGNFNKKEMTEGYNIIEAFFRAFMESIDYMLGKWMHWSVIILVLIMIPILWHIVRKAEYEFKYPMLVLGYSWCYIASLFFMPLYTISIVEVGRFQNVMFMQWIIWLLVDIAYVLGWLQRRYKTDSVQIIVRNEKKYMIGVLSVAFIFMTLSALAEPQKYTSVYAMETWMDPQLATYEEEYWNMVEILNNEERVVEIQDFSYIPEYFDVALRNEGLKLFYDKDKVIVTVQQK